MLKEEVLWTNGHWSKFINFKTSTGIIKSVAVLQLQLEYTKITYHHCKWKFIKSTISKIYIKDHTKRINLNP